MVADILGACVDRRATVILEAKVGLSGGAIEFKQVTAIVMQTEKFQVILMQWKIDSKKNIATGDLGGILGQNLSYSNALNFE